MTQDDTPETEDAPTTLGELNHTNPFTGEAFGATQTYDRGHTVAADGGEAGGRPSDGDGEAGADASDDATADEEDDDPEELRDIEHTPPGDAEGTNAVYERGNEGREEDG
jgi:hypothetical protein